MKHEPYFMSNKNQELTVILLELIIIIGGYIIYTQINQDFLSETDLEPIKSQLETYQADQELFLDKIESLNSEISEKEYEINSIKNALEILIENYEKLSEDMKEKLRMKIILVPE